MAIAYWCVLAAAVLPYLTVGLAKLGGTYDNANPRKLDLYRGIALRADSAHKNGLEVFPLFAIAVLVASGASSKVTVPLLDLLALTWIALRVVYIGVYLAGLSYLRSIVWIIGWSIAIVIFTMPVWHT